MARVYLEGKFNGQTFGPMPNAYLSGSFVGCTFGDLGGEGSPGVDAVNCAFTNAVFAGIVKDFVDRHCTFVGATLPAQIPFYAHDMVMEAFQQGFLLLTPQEKTQISAPLQATRLFVAGRYENSWENAILTILKQFGEASMTGMIESALASQPGLVSHYRRMKALLAARGETWPQ